MSEESKRVLEIEDAADYTDTPIHEWSDGVIAEYRASAKTLARQVEALEAEREWRPIESAPDEGLFLVWLEEPILGSHVHTMHVRPNVRTIASQFAFDCPKPTHWMPQPPEPPK